ncbi:DEAD/DEAH box helicase [Sediminibacterium ginsengisoli]|uniref:Superfamily II DNA or RNA helicase, SNF2 family n=1 Tax=Sediminibacterium ginsengisoli TaxID=413434 RepID=A0A1T4NLC6_9BACT|nr:DEAD/DEAH box helicase [Sediminibacterium ginsengisoli]SJZ79598.1 Superfamily II DNA or RNA helicase, SNF2 family [Sediminibacterium ginsengisoli]
MSSEKVVLLLTPGTIPDFKQVFESLHIERTTKGINYVTENLSGAEIRKSFPQLPKEAQEALEQFSRAKMLAAKSVIKGNGQVTGAVLTETYVFTALMRVLHKQFDKLKPFTSLLKLYHKIRKEGEANFKTMPAAFSQFKPQLSFEVTEEKGSPVLLSYIQLNGTLYPAETFTRTAFLLENNSEYFLLGFRDYQTLDWLSHTDMTAYQNNVAGFSHDILSRLDQDYTVKRKTAVLQQVLEVLPQNRVLFTELNNSFLMLTPQWVYEGFVVDGAWTDTHEVMASGEAWQIKRNKTAETEFIKHLESLHASFARQKNGFFYLSFAEAQKKQWFMKAYHQLLGSDIELVGMDLLQHFRYSSHAAETVINVVETVNGRAKLQLKVSFGKEKVPLHELQKILMAGQRAVMLKDGSLGILPDEWLAQYATLIKHGKISSRQIEVPGFMAISERQHAGNTVLEPLIREDWWTKWKQWMTSDTPVYALPGIVQAALRPYQQKGFEWLALLCEAGAGACLADDMGLGKTLQTICFLAWYLEKNPGTTCLIVCPASLVYNWQSELQKFTPVLSVAVYHGQTRDISQIREQQNDVIITTYGTLRSDENLLQQQYGVCVVDESHNIKNPSAQITRAVNAVTAVHRVALSGTPVVNNTFDLYAQLNFALPGMFGSREFFKKEYADPIDHRRDEEKIKALQKLTNPFILRRTKEQVAEDLPEKTETILWCRMEQRQQDLYNEFSSQVRNDLFQNVKEQGLNKSRLAVLQAITRLRQVCNSPLLLKEEDRMGCRDSVKTSVLMEELTNIAGRHKALVFSQFSSMLDLLAEACDKHGLKYYKFDGQTPPAKRMEMVNAFQQPDDRVPVFLISLKAGNTGLTLTAADYVFLFDPWWNTAVEQQAIDRTHRIGQQKQVFAYKMICRDTIEEKIIRLQERKKQLSDDLVTADEGFVKTLTEDDLAYLFS